VGTDIDTWFTHVAYSKHSPMGQSTIYLGSNAGHLFKVENAQATPETTEIGSDDFPTAAISCVAIGSSEDVLLVTFSNYGVSSVWLTLDGGQTWMEKETNLPDMPIRWAIFHPQNDDQALLATETGVWATNTLRYDDTEWAPAVDGMANVRVDMLKLRSADNVVLAATHGRGLFTTTYELDIFDGIKNHSQPNMLTVYPNPASTTVNIRLNTGNDETTVSLYDLSGKLVHSKALSGMAEYKMDVSGLPKGIYLVKATSGNQQWQQKLVVR
jgi:WD40 repeat protein